MKSNKNIITIIAVALVLLGLTSSLLLSAHIAERVISVVTTATAIVGAIALFYQFKRDKNLHEASFLVEYSQQFYATYNCADLMNELETCRVDENYKLDVDQYYQQIVGYLEWLETLASLVNSGMIQISKIDNVMSYRYFLIVNNKQIQDCELIRNRDFYHSIYLLYPVWVDYKKKHNLHIIFEENDLRKTKGYAEIIANCK